MSETGSETRASIVRNVLLRASLGLFVAAWLSIALFCILLFMAECRTEWRADMDNPGVALVATTAAALLLSGLIGVLCKTRSAALVWSSVLIMLVAMVLMSVIAIWASGPRASVCNVPQPVGHEGSHAAGDALGGMLFIIATGWGLAGLFVSAMGLLGVLITKLTQRRLLPTKDLLND